MAGGTWRELTREAWRAHPLNRVWGWMIPIVLLLVLEGPLEGAMILGGAIADLGAVRSIIGTVEPAWFGWLQLVVGPLVPLVLLVMLFARVRRFPEAYAALRGLTYLFGAVSGAFAAWEIWWVALAQASIIAAEIMLVAYLFLGDRPNVLFRRRVRART